MSCPFPGMDPFLELPAYWSDFHFTFINYWREAIAEALPADYEATLGERASGASSRVAGAATLDPITIPLILLDGPKESYIEILHQPERNLVAALELLSPANKVQPGRTEYLAKRRALLYQQVHLVALDLLLGGRRLPLQNPLPPADCYYLLSRGDHRPDCQVYSWALSEALPTLPVPLRGPDPDIHVNLAAVFATAYERGRFRRRLPYHGLLPEGVPEPLRAWVTARVSEAGAN